MDNEDQLDPTKPFRYVTYDPSGALTGSYYQVLRQEHASAYCAISDQITWQWVFYRMNSTFDGIELIPEDPPVGPEPEEPVQSGD